IGIRTLTYYKEFFHKTISILRQWGVTAPIIAGGPYATSSYRTMLQDQNIDLAVLEEGEITMEEVMTAFMDNGGRIPGDEKLSTIKGIAYVPAQSKKKQRRINREIVLIERLTETKDLESTETPEPPVHPGKSVESLKTVNTVDTVDTVDIEDTKAPAPAEVTAPAYIIYTSGSTGKPKGVVVRHENLTNQLEGLRESFNLGADMNYLVLASFTFDVSVMHLFMPLITGARCHLVDEAFKRDAGKLWPYIQKNRIDILNIVPAFMEVLLQNIEKNKITFKYLFVGGDEFKPALYASLKETFRVEEIINIYGPTETTINATFFRCTAIEPHRPLPIGRPMPNYEAYIIDNDMNPVPVGGVGELIIAGNGVASGYLNKPELTSEHFIKPSATRGYIQNINAATGGTPRETAKPLIKLPYYKTGDFARWRPDGTIEFVGRKDRQLKIRGYRIEPGEIEKRILWLDGIEQAVVEARGEEIGGKYLCAYVVKSKPKTAAKLRAELMQQLPEYMIPTQIVFLEKIPLNASGKPDRHALPEPRPEKGENYVPPGNKTEEKLAEIWAGVLEVSADEPGENTKMGVEDDFFQLGGHSLKATILTAKIHKEFDIKVPLAEIFNNRTIRGLARYMQGTEKKRYEGIGKAEKRDYYKLAAAQKRLYIIDQMTNAGTAYNMPYMIMMPEPFEKEKTENIFATLIRRHDGFRTAFFSHKGEPVQKVHDHIKFKVETRKPVPRIELQKEMEKFVRPFDLSPAPLIRAAVQPLATKRKKKEVMLLVDIHHIISDGVSQDILRREFTTLYAGRQLKPTTHRYIDYAQWQNSTAQCRELEKQVHYWLKRLEDEIPVLNLPLDNPRPPVQAFEGGVVEFEQDETATAAIKKIARQAESTMFMTLLAEYNCLLAKLTGMEDIIVGTPVAARQHWELENIIGIFINMLPLRNTPHRKKSFNQFLREVRQSALEAFENQDMPFSDLVEKLTLDRDMGRNPVFDVMFTQQDLEVKTTRNKPGQEKGQKVIQAVYDHTVARFDLTLGVRERENRLSYYMEYSCKLFKVETIERFANYFKKIVTAVNADPDRAIAEIEIITEEEKRQVKFEFNREEYLYPQHKPIMELFAEQARKTPEQNAIEGRSIRQGRQRMLTYGEFYKETSRLARQLKKKGVDTGTIVAIMTERSVEMMVGIYAILKAGGVYLPILPGYPEERIRFITADTNTHLILTTRHDDEKITLPGEILYLETITGEPEGTETGKPATPADQPEPETKTWEMDGPAYIIYTSGSTGRPKGVLIEQRALLNRLNWMQRYYPLHRDDVILQKTTIVFDVSIWELFWWSCYGATLSLLGPGEEKSPEAIINAIAENKVTTIHFVPSMLNAFLQHLEETKNKNLEKLATLRQVFASGEALGEEQAETFFRTMHKHSGTKLINLYGPTEATVDVSYYECEAGAARTGIPIGKPIDNIQLYIVDKSKRLQPPGIAGELCIAGMGLARGYLNRPQLTAEKFIETPAAITQAPGRSRLYMTGDLAKWRHDGNICYLGRIDHQVKLRGFRIELGEIENKILKHPEIKDTAVTVYSAKGGDKYICAYVVGTGKRESREQEEYTARIRDYLARNLPEYMIPTAIMELETLPLTGSGKLDRKALPPPLHQSTAAYTAPRTPTEEKLTEIFALILDKKKNKIGIDDNFFEMGGHSLKAINLISHIHKQMNIKIPMPELFKTTTIRAIAGTIRKSGQQQYTA
ncbi:MAG: amino acid adenylation domain-containing protein, partial [bacterium]|nr:amino acid adenylation domain-containing protein [bacterium]